MMVSFRQSVVLLCSKFFMWHILFKIFSFLLYQYIQGLNRLSNVVSSIHCVLAILEPSDSSDYACGVDQCLVERNCAI